MSKTTMGNKLPRKLEQKMQTVGELGYESLRGWTLSPAYDMNPTTNEYQSLLINSSTNKSDLNLLLGSSEEYMIGKEEASKIIQEVTNAIKGWQKMADSLGIAKREMELLGQILD